MSNSVEVIVFILSTEFHTFSWFSGKQVMKV